MMSLGHSQFIPSLKKTESVIFGRFALIHLIRSLHLTLAIFENLFGHRKNDYDENDHEKTPQNISKINPLKSLGYEVFCFCFK